MDLLVVMLFPDGNLLNLLLILSNHVLSLCNFFFMFLQLFFVQLLLIQERILHAFMPLLQVGFFVFDYLSPPLLFLFLLLSHQHWVQVLALVHWVLGRCDCLFFSFLAEHVLSLTFYTFMTLEW